MFISVLHCGFGGKKDRFCYQKVYITSSVIDVKSNILLQ